MGCTHAEAVDTLRIADDEIAMLICHGFCDVTVLHDACAAASIAKPLVLSRHSNVLTVDTNTLVTTGDVDSLCQFTSWWR